MTLSSGTKLGPYEILTLLGAGAYCAKNRTGKEWVAGHAVVATRLPLRGYRVPDEYPMKPVFDGAYGA